MSSASESAFAAITNTHSTGLDALFPVMVMSGAMDNCQNDHGVVNQLENDAIGEWSRVGPADLFAPVTNSIQQRIYGQMSNLVTCRPKKLKTQARLFLVVFCLRVEQ